MKNKEYILIYCLVVFKLLFHFLTNTNFGLHRDEYLYFDEGQHLAWGFLEVPPFTPFLAKIADLLGGSVFMIRLFPALAGALIIYLSCKLVVDLGGKYWAVLFTGVALLFSPALLGSNTLFQPVSFNQLFWFLSAWCLVKLIISNNKQYWWLLGLLMGIGFLNKYSIFLYLLALLIAILVLPQRKLLRNKHFLSAVLITILIALPNIIWQFKHDIPLLRHMQVLRENQLVHVNWGAFLGDQLLFHFTFSLIWISGIIALFKIKALRPYRFVGLAFVINLLIIGLLQGKSYYTLGAFLILFPFGGIALEKWIKPSLAKSSLLLGMCLLVLPILPFTFPVFKPEMTKRYIKYINENYGLEINQTWEDGELRSLPQDFADMQGWEEMVRKVANIYHELSADEQQKCMIYGGSYGHAGAINYFRGKYKLPEAYSLSSSYVLWAKEDIDFSIQIMIDDNKQETSSYFNTMILRDSVENPDARDPGYIYLRTEPKIDVRSAWRDLVLENRPGG